MLSPAILVVFVVASAPGEPAMPPFEQAAHEVLGPSAELRMERVTTLPPDAVALERAGAADGVVEMSWKAARQTAVLHCYIASEQRWVDRTIHFEAADRERDRERLLGFAVAAMFIGAPGFARGRAEDPAILEPAPSESVSTLPVAAPRPAPPAPDAGQSAGSHDVSRARTVEFAGVATSGVGSADAFELGALAALGVPLSDPFSVRIQVQGREGEIAPAQAVVRRVIAGVGFMWSALPETSRVELRIRADGLGSWFQVSHLSDDDVASVKNHGWLVGGDAVASLGYRVSTLLTLSAGVGLEAMSGNTHVFTHGVERATLPALRGLGEFGFVAHF